MRFATRTFLWSVVPFAVVLMGSFWAVQKVVISTVQDDIRASLRDNNRTIAQMRQRGEQRNSRLLRVVGENAALKAGLQLALADPTGADARLTVEDQLREISGNVGFDFLLVSSAAGTPLAGVIRNGEQLDPMNLAHMEPLADGVLMNAGHVYQVTSVPVDQGGENIAVLCVGERFDFAEFTTPVVLMRRGKVVRSTLQGITPDELNAAFATCHRAECEVPVRGQTWLAVAVDNLRFGDGYALSTLQNLDAAAAPVRMAIKKVFLATAGSALLIALILSALSSRSIVRPIDRVMAQLHESENSGLVPEIDIAGASIREIRELAESFNRSAAAVRAGKEKLERAYLDFVRSLASALDARDRYTAGHSRRVSDYSCAVAEVMGASAAELQVVRIGALLHDIGKIGIPDAVLQKPARLSEEEFAQIKRHPAIGRMILEGVDGFAAYLEVVELHHENWDGTGYPHGLCRKEPPLGARIVHVADAYDAMTSDRPYRKGMARETALRILRENAGTQFDPEIVETFVALIERTGDCVEADSAPVESNA